RPPNAFLLYRSDFLKRRTIPREVEKRQQNLSRIIGECWNTLSAEEKAVWREKAAAVTAAHQAKYPHYKF
ncbi:high mobility group box domain-containing protein, partial [Pisolithus sp. B1]